MDLSPIWQRAATWLLPIAAALAIVGIVAWGLATDDDTPPPFLEAGPQTLPPQTADTLGADTMLADPVANLFHTDTAYLSLDTAYSLSPERRAAERQRLQRAEQAFRLQYERVAQGILANVYTPELLRGDRDTFIQASTQAMQRLVMLASSMGRQHGLDPPTAEAIGGEVIASVTDRLRDAAMRQP